MKIKLAILENDTNYLNRIVAVFNDRYSSKVEVFGFSEVEIAIHQLQSMKVDVVIFSESYIQQIKAANIKAVPIIMVESNDISDIEGYSVVCKYQKVDLIYKKILAVYSANTNYSFVVDQDDILCKTIVFTGIAGGVGTSSVALGYALHLVKQGKKVLYLDFNIISTTEAFLSGEGIYSMSDILYAIKSKKNNIGMKIESVIRKDEWGIDYIKETDSMLDMIEMSDEEAKLIWEEVCRLEAYDFILVDMPLRFKDGFADIITRSQAVVWVSNGSVIGNAKLERVYRAAQIIEGQGMKFQVPNLTVIYNAFSNKTGKVLDDSEIRIIGGVPKIENASARQVIEYISGLQIFDMLLEEK